MANTRDRLTKRYPHERMHGNLGHERELIHSNLLRTTVPTLPYAAFDSSGEKVLPWHLMRFLGSNDLGMYWPLGDVNSTTLVYLIHFEINIDSSLYDMDSPKHPLQIETSFRYVKNTSRALVSTLRHPTRTVPYAEAEYVDVMVDPVTRKPMPFPEWWKTKHGIPSEGKRKEHIMPSKPEPLNTMVTEHKVAYSDVDANGHANYTFYARACVNSFVENMLAERLNKDAVMHFSSGLKKLEMTFHKECLMGDIVQCESWEDEIPNNSYYFNVISKGEVCTKLTLVWHTTPSVTTGIATNPSFNAVSNKL